MARASRNDQRKGRHRSMRGRIRGTAERPRLNVYRSTAHMYAQLIDDTTGSTVAASSTLGSENGGSMAAAKQVGASIAEKAKAAGVTQVVFDRGGMKYHGRVRAVAEGAREAGLDF